jgi:hypothetical protein
MTTTAPHLVHVYILQNAHVLQAVLILLRELDKDSLEIVQNTIQRKLSTDT